MKRGEVWLINLDPTVGAEISKTPPAIVVNDDDVGTLPLRIMVPITEWREHYGRVRWMVHVAPTNANGLLKESAADVFQIKSVSVKRFVRNLSEVSPAVLDGLSAALAVVLKIPRLTVQ
jgi:mRNA interferase MazF